MTLSAVLLAGGESRRMGRDKAVLMYEGEPLWKRQLRLLRAVSAETLFVSARRELPWRPAELELLLDTPSACGPISGIAAALARIETTHLLVLAVDMPFMTLQVLLKLVRLATEKRGVVPVIGKVAEPLAAIYPRMAHDEFMLALNRNELSLQPLVRRLIAKGKVSISQVNRAQADLYRSINRPEDLLSSSS